MSGAGDLHLVGGTWLDAGLIWGVIRVCFGGLGVCTTLLVLFITQLTLVLGGVELSE